MNLAEIMDMYMQQDNHSTVPQAQPDFRHPDILRIEQMAKDQALVDTSLDFLLGPIGRSSASAAKAAMPIKPPPTKPPINLTNYKNRYTDPFAYNSASDAVRILEGLDSPPSLHKKMHTDTNNALTDFLYASDASGIDKLQTIHNNGLASLSSNKNFNIWKGDDTVQVAYHTTDNKHLQKFSKTPNNISYRQFQGTYLSDDLISNSMWAHRGDETIPFALKNTRIADSNTVIPDKYRNHFLKQIPISSRSQFNSELSPGRKLTFKDIMNDGKYGGAPAEIQAANSSILEKMGYSGVRYNDEIILFNPNDVKALYGNNGKFSTKDNNFYKGLLPPAAIGLTQNGEDDQ